MELAVGVLLTAFVIIVAVMALRQGKQNRGKTYEQRRDQVFERYEQRMEEFRKTEMKEGESKEEQ